MEQLMFRIVVKGSIQRSLQEIRKRGLVFQNGVYFPDNRKVSFVVKGTKEAVENWLVKSKERLGPVIPQRNKWGYKKDIYKPGDLLDFKEV